MLIDVHHDEKGRGITYAQLLTQNTKKIPKSLHFWSADIFNAARYSSPLANGQKPQLLVSLGLVRYPCPAWRAKLPANSRQVCPLGGLKKAASFGAQRTIWPGRVAARTPAIQ